MNNMAGRVVTRVGKDAPKYLRVIHHQSGGFHSASAAAAAAASSSSGIVTTMGINQAKSAQQIGLYDLQQIFGVGGRFFSDKTTAPPPPPPPPPEGEEKEKSQAEEEATTTEGEKAKPEEEGTQSADPEIPREEQLEIELKTAKDQLLRSLAEQENTRRIAQRDVSDARNFAVKSFAKSLLEVSDNLTRALEVVPEDMRHDKENHATLATLYEGIEMTESGLNKAFEMNGLKKFGKSGERFDPNKHEALYEYPDPEKKPGTVGQVIKVGFMLNDRVLRPAEVGVVKKED